MITKFLRDESGATAIEYALLGCCIFLAIVAAVIPIGGTLEGVFQDVDAGFNQ